MSIAFENYEDIKGIDLNKIDQKQVDLIPRGIGEIHTLEPGSPKRGNGGTVVSEEDSSLRVSSKGNGE